MNEDSKKTDTRYKKYKRRYKKKDNGLNRIDNKSVVINLSKKDLTKKQINLLSKGETFVPNNRKPDVPNIMCELKEWKRRMRLREFFYDSQRENNDNEVSEEWCDKKKSNSCFTPNSGRDKCLDAYIDAVKEEILKGMKKKEVHNISRLEEIAMKDLLEDGTIVIRPADKGSGIVILDSDKYNEDIENELKDASTYKHVSEDPTAMILKTTKKLINRMDKDRTLPKRLSQYLIPDSPRPGQIKGNPKIHKPDNPLRLIISGIGTVTEQVAELAEKELDEFVINTPSYIKDTSHFLNEIKDIKNLPNKNAILFCFDVEKLYPSIPKNDGLEACKEALAYRKSKQIPDEEILNMIQLVLENNNFEHNGKHYIQVDGTAIGSKLGKNYACTYMRIWDRKLSEFRLQPLIYKRFIDDGFGIWTHGIETLQQFTEYANNIHSKINIKLRHSHKQIEFLDTLVILENGNIETDFYSKETDTHIYLHKDSDHPRNTKQAIPHGLGIRLKRICSDDNKYYKQRSLLGEQLKSRGYKTEWINRHLKRADQTSRKEALEKKNKPMDQGRIPLVLTYSSYLPDTHKIVKKNMSILQKSKRMTDVFRSPPIVAYKRSKNFRDILIHGKLKKKERHNTEQPL
ncbi:uncharacterized protein LOC132745064 [Ruditapes philippinarum]|uniref:uncharacterized protein LOC132745064 n=1 Tax=Ruditapes philippinarum TaxID=129788 RepID=UPI00295A59DF|nr:uncharacterized protein LOC132745064 [Ruditapes philippinarum]